MNFDFSELNGIVVHVFTKIVHRVLFRVSRFIDRVYFVGGW